MEWGWAWSSSPILLWSELGNLTRLSPILVRKMSIASWLFHSNDLPKVGRLFHERLYDSVDLLLLHHLFDVDISLWIFLDGGQKVLWNNHAHPLAANSVDQFNKLDLVVLKKKGLINIDCSNNPLGNGGGGGGDRYVTRQRLYLVFLQWHGSCIHYFFQNTQTTMMKSSMFSRLLNGFNKKTSQTDVQTTKTLATIASTSSSAGT